MEINNKALAKMLLALCVVFSSIFFSVSLFASEESVKAEAEAPANPQTAEPAGSQRSESPKASAVLRTSPASKAVLSPASVIGQMVLGLTFVVGVIFALAWLARRMGYGNLPEKSGMRVVASLALGNREKAVLLEVNKKQLLLGVTANNVTCLQQFDAEDTLETENSSGDRKSPASLDFSQYLKSLVNHGNSR